MMERKGDPQTMTIRAACRGMWQKKEFARNGSTTVSWWRKKTMRTLIKKDVKINSSQLIAIKKLIHTTKHAMRNSFLINNTITAKESFR